MERYAVIHTKFPREFILLQGTGCRYFEYMSVNLFCNNSTNVQRDDTLAERFLKEIYPLYKNHPKVEILLENTDLGVG